MSRVRALVIASHPGPSLAITALAALLAAQAAPHGIGPALTAPAMLALQFSIGWSNDAFDASRDAAAGRTDKPLATGAIGPGPVWAAAGLSLMVALGMALSIGTTTGIITAVMAAAGWAYNAGLKSMLASGLMYLVGFGLVPAYAASTLPGHPWPRWQVTVAAALIGLGAHFVNVLPDLAADRATGVRGLPQQVAALAGGRASGRAGGGSSEANITARGEPAVRACAIVLLLAASALLLAAARPGRRWIAAAGLAASAALAVVSARGRGRVPFGAAIGIAAVDVVLFATGGEALTS
ncbi:MAG TPA: UbiA family prenyltransferase [Trebonia sp.]